VIPGVENLWDGPEIFFSIVSGDKFKNITLLYEGKAPAVLVMIN
jgi:hypothetical protein